MLMSVNFEFSLSFILINSLAISVYLSNLLSSSPLQLHRKSLQLHWISLLNSLYSTFFQNFLFPYLCLYSPISLHLSIHLAFSLNPALSLFHFLSIDPVESLAYSLLSSISFSLAFVLFILWPEFLVLVFLVSPSSSTFLLYSHSHLFRCHSGDLFLYPSRPLVLFYSSPYLSIYLSFPASSSSDANLSLYLSISLFSRFSSVADFPSLINNCKSCRPL